MVLGPYTIFYVVLVYTIRYHIGLLTYLVVVSLVTIPYENYKCFYVSCLLRCTHMHTFIPIHKKIQEGNFSQATLTNLVKLNWYRTAIWTAIFVLSYFLVY